MLNGLSLMAQVMAGRPLTVGVTHTYPTHTDGEVLWVPPDPTGHRTAVAVQAGLVATGGLNSRAMTRLLGRRSAARRYLILEVVRVVSVLGEVLPTIARDELRALRHVVPPCSAAESLQRALSNEPVESGDLDLGILRPSLVLRAAGVLPAPAEDTSFRRIDKLRDFTNHDLHDDVDEGDERSAHDHLTAPLGRNPVARLLRNLMGSGLSGSSSNGDGGAEIAVAGARAVREGSAGGRISSHAGVALLADQDALAGAVYPEWDHRHERFRPAHCTVHHYDPTPADRTELRHEPDLVLQRSLARVGLAPQRHRRLADGEDLDLQALVDHDVARAAGYGADGLVYESRRPTAHDLGVVVLLDASGSTALGGAVGKRIWDEQRQLTAGLVSSLQQVGDRVAAYGFRSHGRSDVRMLRIKHFDDRFDGAAQRRLSDLQPSGYTRLGAAVRHGQALATLHAGTSRQLIMLISDGLPYEEGYQRRYAEADTNHALQEAVTSGVACVCVSIGTTQDPDALERVWGAVNHVRVEEASEVARRIESLIRSGLKAALDASHGLANPLW